MGHGVSGIDERGVDWRIVAPACERLGTACPR
jgi:hypothetical protein